MTLIWPFNYVQELVFWIKNPAFVCPGCGKLVRKSEPRAKSKADGTCVCLNCLMEMPL